MMVEEMTMAIGRRSPALADEAIPPPLEERINIWLAEGQAIERVLGEEQRKHEAAIAALELKRGLLRDSIDQMRDSVRP